MGTSNLSHLQRGPGMTMGTFRTSSLMRGSGMTRGHFAFHPDGLTGVTSPFHALSQANVSKSCSSGV